MGLRDPISSASHLFVAVWAVFALLLMLKQAQTNRRLRIAVAVYGASMVMLYLASGVFHGLPISASLQPAEFRFFQMLDQSSIFLVIAGTNTPLMIAFLKGRHRVACLGAIWGLAAVGILCLWLLPKANHAWIVGIFIALGWTGMLPMRHYYRAVGWRAMNWVWLGCLLYMVAAVCELAEWPVLFVSPYRFGFHEIFHIVSALASAVFFLFILRYVIPLQASTSTNHQGAHHEKRTSARGGRGRALRGVSGHASSL